MQYKPWYIVVPVALLLTISLAVLAQHFFRQQGNNDQPVLPGLQEEYRKLAARFIGSDSFQNLSGTIRLYDGQSPEALKETQHFHFCREGTSAFYSLLGYQQTISNGHMVVVLDTVDKQILVSRMPDGTQPGATGNIQPGSLFSDTTLSDITGTVSEEGNERAITFRNENIPEISYYRIVYDKASYQLKRSEITWWKNGTAILDSTKKDQVWITKIDYQFNKELPVDIDKTLESILTIQGGKVVPTAAYSRYEIRTGN